MPRKKSIGPLEVFCICQQPYDDQKDMIECSFCQEWFHLSCIGLTNDEFQHFSQQDIDFICDLCKTVISENPSLPKASFERLRGQVSPKSGWTNDIVLDSLTENQFECILVSDRIKKEGYTMFYNSKVLSVESCVLSPYVFFRSVVRAAMKQNNYIVTICFRSSPLLLKWVSCSCPAGVQGECKHSVATFFYIRHCILTSCTTFPDAPACTDLLQSWNAKKFTNDLPTLFSELRIEKPVKDKGKRPLGGNIKSYSENVDISKFVSQDSLKKLAADLEFANFPILDVWKARDFTPVIRKETRSFILIEELFEKIRSSTFDFDFMQIYMTELESSMKFYENMIAMSFEESQILTVKTLLQSQSSCWKKKRFYLLTASTFKKFIRMRDSTDAATTHMNLNTNITSAALNHGKHYEETAIKIFLESIEIEGNLIEQSAIGLVVNPKLPFLGASPDYLIKINIDGQPFLVLLEIKCPYSLYMSKKKIIQAAEEDKDFYLNKSSTGLVVNKNHAVCYQMQGQLNICNVDFGFLVIFVPPKDIQYIKVQKDPVFFNNVMLPKLSQVWFQKLLPGFTSLL